MPKTQAQGVPAILNLRLWPYGNARENPDKTFTCQHGAAECKVQLAAKRRTKSMFAVCLQGNMIEACGMNQVGFNNTAKWCVVFPFGLLLTFACDRWPYIRCLVSPIAPFELQFSVRV